MRIGRNNPNSRMVATILTLAWPTMLEELLQTAVQYIDTAMVGSLGTQATAAVGATTTVNWLFSSSVSALSIGFLAYIAKANGADDQEGASKAAAQAVTVTMLVGVVLTVLTVLLSSHIPVWMKVDPSIRDLAAKYFLILYLPMLPRTAMIIFGTVLRSAGDTKSPMKIGLLVNVVNVFLNFLLIYPTRTILVFEYQITLCGAGWGVFGAAAASAAAFTIGGICMTLILWKHPLISPKGQTLKPDRQILLPCLRIALPNMLQRFGTSLGYVAFASIINSLGDVATAAHTIANTVESAFYIPGYGMQTAAATLAGNAYGAKDQRQMKHLVSMFIPIEVILMIVSGGSLLLLAKPLVSLFSTSDTVIYLATTVLCMVAVTEPFYGFSIIMEGFLQGVGKTKAPFIYNILGMWGIRIVGTYICISYFGLGLISAWACMIAHNLFLFLMFLISYLRGSWNPLKRMSE